MSGEGPSEACREQLKAWVTANAWVDYESSVEEDLGRAVIDWWEATGDPEEVRDPHDLAVSVGAIVARWDERLSGDGHRPMKRAIVHCRMSFSGADWDLASVLNLIDGPSTGLAWVADPGGHELRVCSPDGRRHHFHVPRPSGAIVGPLLAPWEAP